MIIPALGLFGGQASFPFFLESPFFVKESFPLELCLRRSWYTCHVGLPFHALLLGPFWENFPFSPFAEPFGPFSPGL